VFIQTLKKCVGHAVEIAEICRYRKMNRETLVDRSKQIYSRMWQCNASTWIPKPHKAQDDPK